jgi:hypothetical protein
MSSRSGTTLPEKAKRIQGKNRRRGGLPSMSESQAQAYLSRVMCCAASSDFVRRRL